MTLAFLALLGAPYIYDISSLRVNHYASSSHVRYTAYFKDNSPDSAIYCLL